MTTAVVVTTIVTDQAGETNFMGQLLDQIRKQETDLRAKFTHSDQEVTVTSAIFPLADFAHHLQEWVQHKKNGVRTVGNGGSRPPHTLDELSEAELMDYVFAQMQQNATPTYAALSPEDLAEMEDEPIGDYFSQNPFLH
jgi:hypothetical protein